MTDPQPDPWSREQGSLVTAFRAHYLDNNPEVSSAARRDPIIRTALTVLTETVHQVDGVLRAWQIPLVQRQFMIGLLFESAFGTAGSRIGADMASQLKAAERVTIGSWVDGDTVELLWSTLRYEDGSWSAVPNIEVDTPANGG